METWETKNGTKIIRILSGRSNVFLLIYNGKNLLVDTSPGFMWPVLERRLKKLNITSINYLILTHAHFDHAANSNRIRTKFKASVIIQQKEARYLCTGRNPHIGGTNFISGFIARYFANAAFLNYEPCLVDFKYDCTLDLNPYGFNATLLHTPGHTKGSSSLIVDNEIALAGDCMFGIFIRSTYPPFAEDPEELVRSWGKLLQTGCSLFLPSHGAGRQRSVLQKEYDKRMKQQISR